MYKFNAALPLKESHFSRIKSKLFILACIWEHGLQKQTAVVVESLSCVLLFATPCNAARKASLSFTVSQSLFKFMSIEGCHLTISSSAALFFFCLWSFTASGSFPMSQLFAPDGQSIGALASVLPLNIHGWFPLGLTSLISLLSRVLYLSSNASPSLINSETLGNCLLSLSHLPLLYLGDKKSNHLSASLCGLNKLMHGKGSEHVPDVCCVIIIIFPVFISPRGEKLNKTS